MTINKVLERVDKLRPNALDQETKSGWLLDLEQKLWEEVILRHMDAPQEVDRVTRYPEDADTELIVPAPYDELYVLYLESRIDHYHGEDAAYVQSASIYNDALDQWRVRYHRDHLPLNGPGIKTI